MESQYSWTPAARKEFRAWLFATDHIARPNPKYAEHKVIEREEVCRDYLEREELKVEYVQNPNFRTCTKCGKEKPLISFYKSSTGGHSAVCKECQLAHQKEYYNKNLKRELKRVPTPEKKVCRECGKEKPIEAFRRNFASPDGFTHVCMECSKKKLSATIAGKSGKPPKKSAPAVEAEPDPAPAPMPVDIEELTPEKVAVETPQVKRGAEIVAEPMTIIESPHWIRIIPDDELYAELLRRGWEGTLYKQLKKRA